MSYKPSELSVLAYANTFTLWHYTTPDQVNDVFKKGYFNQANNMLRKNDLIILNAGKETRFVLVSENDGESVSLVDFQATAKTVGYS